MKDRIAGLIIAGIAIIAASIVYGIGYDHGRNHGESEVRTRAVRANVAYWRVNQGEATFEWRYCMPINDTCVKYGD